MPTTADTVQRAIKRTALQRFDLPGTNYETVIELTEISPKAVVGRHTHPGTEVAYVLQGDITLEVDGELARTFKSGESYKVPMSVVHAVRGGSTGGKAVLVWTVEKGRTFRSLVG